MSLVSIGSLSSFPNSVFLACELSGQYLKNSLLFTIPYQEDVFRDKIRRINLHLDLTIICYDKGSMYSASRVGCLLIAVGYTNVKVFYGGLKACYESSLPLVDEIPEPVPLTERTLLLFKENFILTKDEFMHMNTKNIETIYSNFLYKHIYHTYDQPSKENILKFLNEANIHIQNLTNPIFYGELAPLLAIFALSIGITQFSVVLIDFDCSDYGRQPSLSSSNTIYVSLGEVSSEKSMVSVELEHYSSPLKKPSSKTKQGSNSPAPPPCGRQCCCVV